MNARQCSLAWWRRQTKQWNQRAIVTPFVSFSTIRFCLSLLWIDKFSLLLRRKRTQTPANYKAINVLDLFGNRDQANTNWLGTERSIIELGGMFDYH